MAKVKSSSYETDAELAEQQYVEDKIGDKIRSSLDPLCGLLQDVNPEGHARLVGEELTGEEWIAIFIAPLRFGWRGKSFGPDIAWRVSDLLYTLEQLTERTAQSYRDVH